MSEARSKRIQKERGPGPVRCSCWPWTEETVLSQTREDQCDCVSKLGELASLIPEERQGCQIKVIGWGDT